MEDLKLRAESAEVLLEQARADIARLEAIVEKQAELIESLQDETEKPKEELAKLEINELKKFKQAYSGGDYQAMEARLMEYAMSADLRDLYMNQAARSAMSPLRIEPKSGERGVRYRQAPIPYKLRVEKRYDDRSIVLRLEIPNGEARCQVLDHYQLERATRDDGYARAFSKHVADDMVSHMRLGVGHPTYPRMVDNLAADIFYLLTE